MHAGRVKVVVIPNATHFVHLDRPERGRRFLLDETGGFVRGAHAHWSAAADPGRSDTVRASQRMELTACELADRGVSE